jgi:hypothetical protein
MGTNGLVPIYFQNLKKEKETNSSPHDDETNNNLN